MQSIENDLQIAKGSANLNDAINYKAVLTNDVDYPMDESMQVSLKTVRMNISYTTDDEQKIIDYMDHLIDANYIYYIASMQMSFLMDGNVQVEMIVYTFYNQVS